MSFANIWPFFVAPIIGFAIGGFPTAFIVVKSVTGIDPRKFGSGSVSTRNTIRAAGLWPWGAVTFMTDITKGMLACAIVEYLISPLVRDSASPDYTEFFVILCGLTAVASHCWMPYTGFKGGKGLGTFGGLLFYFYWPTTLLWPFIALFVMIRLTGFSGFGACWSALFISPFWYLIDTIGRAVGPLDNLPIAFWPHEYFADGEMGWSFILLYALGMWLILTLRHIPEFGRIKRGEAQVWKSLKTTEMLK